MKRKYVTKNLVARISKLTNDTFKAAIMEVMICDNLSDEGLQGLAWDLRRITQQKAFGIQLDEADIVLSEQKEKIDQIYLRKIIELPTETLEDILFLHNKDKMKRANQTLEEIKSELTRRMLFNDTTKKEIT